MGVYTTEQSFTDAGGTILEGESNYDHRYQMNTSRFGTTSRHHGGSLATSKRDYEEIVRVIDPPE